MAPTVLIVDDALFMRMMIKDILSKDGFEVIGEAENGVEAVKKYAELRPNVVTMDIVMPEMDGIEAVRNIMKIDPWARVLMCSAMGQQPLVVEALEAGAKDFIIKPFQPSKVVEAVRKALQNEG
ncbi:MAG: response regulator [Actinomycetia bacterium]|nr:response regulator [Actinomycetota bacterium]MBU4240440.1 response regulator [Actinomycetota bacterium]MBU4302331.1 response regulator [Actinomycetota bacterium]MCG2794430.1 response regulator [Actinomycetes bacterium]